MGVLQSPGLTHPSQRYLGPLSPSAVPVPLGQVTLNPLGCFLGVGDPGCQQRGHLGRDLKASHGKMGVSPSMSGSPESGRCHLSAGCEGTETSVPQAGHVVSLSPPPGGVLTGGATPRSLESESCSPVAFLPDTEETLWGAGARGRSGAGCCGGSGCCQVSARVPCTAIGMTGWLIPPG